jgi:hypothetical protein
LVGANTVNGPVPCKVTANSALSKLELKYLGPLFFDAIPVIVLSAGGVVVVIIVITTSKDCKKHN